MAKERMITRTIINSEVTVKLYDNIADEVTTTVLEIQGKLTDMEELKKACQNRLNGANYTVLKIVDAKSTEKLYAMPEATFLLYAKEVPARNIKEEEEEV